MVYYNANLHLQNQGFRFPNEFPSWKSEFKWRFTTLFQLGSWTFQLSELNGMCLRVPCWEKKTIDQTTLKRFAGLS